MDPSSEFFDNLLQPICTNMVANMPYACFGNERCSPYGIGLYPGKYSIEVWGASGGDTIHAENIVYGGLGGYVKVLVNIKSYINIFFYIGAQGNNKSTKAFNGGGHAGKHDNTFGSGGGGGGATDARLHPLSKGKSASLNSRFVVAGAGGGATPYIGGARGGNNLGLIGEDGIASYKGQVDPFQCPTGGNQEKAGKSFYSEGENLFFGEDGDFGNGGDIYMILLLVLDQVVVGILEEEQEGP